MRVLAVEKEIRPGKFNKALYEREARGVYALYKDGKIREIFFTKEDHAAVILLEVSGIAQAKKLLGGLPLVKSGCIVFELKELLPYTGYDRILKR